MSELRPNRRKDRNKDPRGLAYMAWIRTLPCAVCNGRYYVECAHIGGNIAAKASNFRCIPLCRGHHRLWPESEEKLKRRFGPHHGIDVEALILKLNQEFERREQNT